jgi:hypothetical protein
MTTNTLSWIRSDNSNSPVKFLRDSLRGKIGDTVDKLRVLELVRGLSRYFTVVKLVRVRSGEIKACTDVDGSNWDQYQVGYLLIQKGNDVCIDEVISEAVRKITEEICT